MRDIKKWDLWLRILLILIITAFSGIAPTPHSVKQAMVRIDQQQGKEATMRSANDLALIATHFPWQNGFWEATGHHAYVAGDMDLAISSFKKAAAKGVLSSEGYLVFGDAYTETGNPYTAGQIWEAAIAIFGPSEDLLTSLANAQRITGDPRLTNTLKSLLTLQRSNGSPSLIIAQTYYELGMLLAVENPDSASPYLLQAVELDPKLTDAGALAFTIQRALPQENPTYTLMAVGRELANQDKWNLAMRVFQKVTRLQPDYAESWAFLGEAIQHLDEEAFENALVPLKTALELEPELLSGNIFMAFYWKKTGNQDQYYHYLAKAANIDPDNPAILVDLGEAAAVQGDLDSGFYYLMEAVELTRRDPSYLRALVNFCIRYNYNLRESALPIARQAIIADHNNPVTLDIMGQVLFRLGDMVNAERFYFRALEKDPSYAPAFLHLGLVYDLMGQAEKAANAFAMAIALAPGTTTASQAEHFLNPSTPPK